jgi:hypothetical protein
MHSRTQGRAKAAFIALVPCLLLIGGSGFAKDSLWQKAMTEDRRLWEQANYAEAEKAF